MKKYKLLVSLLAMFAPGIVASNSGMLHIKEMNVNRGENRITLNMLVDANSWRPGSNNIVVLTPMFVSENDTLKMAPLRIAGKNAWTVEMRENRKENDLKRAGSDGPISYSHTTDYNPIFDQSQIILQADTIDICHCRPVSLGHGSGFWPIGRFNVAKKAPRLAFSYVAPKDSAEKLFQLSGKANIIFKVNRTEIDWSYDRNRAELDTILKTINAVRDNSDASVRGIYLTGFASPEGSYANNVRLAKGRTEAVKDYVVKNSTFPKSVYHTNYVPEDWEGLYFWLESNYIPNREEMLEFINDGSIPAPERNDIFRSKFPQEYPFLLQNVYPSLRHTDYRIVYNVRKYYDVAEIKEVMRTNPRNLSLNELFLLANSMTPGSEEYDEVFELAALLYPDSKVANLNAANSAMNQGNFKGASRYLERAGEGPEVDYAKGLLLCKEGDYEAALPLLMKALNEGIPQAKDAIQEIEKAKNFTGEIEIL